MRRGKKRKGDLGFEEDNNISSNFNSVDKMIKISETKSEKTMIVVND